MTIVGYVDSAEYSMYAFSFEMRGNKYSVPKSKPNEELITHLYTLAQQDKFIEVRYEDTDFCGQKAINLLNVKEMPKPVIQDI